MAENNYEAGHLVKLYMEIDPEGAQGVFTEIGHISSGDLENNLTKETTDVTVRGKRIDTHFVNPILKRDNWTFTITVVPDDAVQLAIRSAAIDTTTHGFMQRGVDAAGDPSDSYEIISGEIVTYRKMAPYGQGPVRREISIRPSGNMILDGVEVGD